MEKIEFFYVKAIKLLIEIQQIDNMPFLQQYRRSSNPNDKAIMINNKQLSYNYNQYKLLNMIYIIHKRRVLNHIKKFIIWMI